MSGFVWVNILGTVYSLLILYLITQKAYAAAIALGFFAFMNALANLVRAIESKGSKF